MSVRDLKEFFQQWTSHSSDRKNIIIKSTFLSGFFKGINVLANLYFVRVSIDQLETTQFGLWLTLYSLITWMTLFDFGFGNGLRNKLTESIAAGDNQTGQRFVSLTYSKLIKIFGTLSLISVILTLLYFLTPHQLPFSKEVVLAFGFVFVGSCFLFVLKLIHIIFQANNRVYVPDAIILFCQIIIIVIIKLTGVSEIIAFSAINMLVPIILYIGLSVYFFKTKFYSYRPILSLNLKSETMELGNLSSLSKGFFIIQFFGVLIFSTDNLIISWLLDLDSVTHYNIPYRYFSVLITISSIVLGPYWSLSTVAYVKNDFTWIKRASTRLLIVFAGLTSVSVLMMVIANWSYSVWLGENITIPYSLTLAMVIYVACLNFAAIYNTFCYGIGSISAIVKLSMIGSLFNLIIKIVGVKIFGGGLETIILANILYALAASIVSYTSLQNSLKNPSNYAA